MASKYSPSGEKLPEDVPKTKIFVGNIDDRVTSEDLHKLFSKYGHVDECDAIGGGRHGFVHMSTDEEAQRAIAALNDTLFMGNIILVKQSNSRSHRWPGSPGRKLAMFGVTSPPVSEVEQSVPEGYLSAQCDRNIKEQSPTKSGNFSEYKFNEQCNYSPTNASNLLSRQSLESQINISLGSNRPLQQSYVPLPNFVPFPDPNNPSQHRMPFSASNVNPREHATYLSNQPNIGQSCVASLATQPDVNIQSCTAGSTPNVSVQRRTESSIQPNVSVQRRTESSIQPNVSIQRRTESSIQPNVSIQRRTESSIQPNVSIQRRTESSIQPNVSIQRRTESSIQPNVSVQRRTESSIQPNVSVQRRTESSFQPNVNIQHQTESSHISNLNLPHYYPFAYSTYYDITCPQPSAPLSFPSNVNVSRYLAANPTELNVNAPYNYHTASTHPSVRDQYYIADSSRPSVILQRDYTESSNRNESIFQQHCATASNQPPALLQRHDSNVSNQPTISKGFGPYDIHPTINRGLQNLSSVAPDYIAFRQREPRTQRGPPPVRGDHSINVGTSPQVEHAFRNLNINASIPQAQPRTTEPVPRSSDEEGNQSLESPEYSSSFFHYGMPKRE